MFRLLPVAWWCAVLLILASGCEHPELGGRFIPLGGGPAGRKALGVASPYPADGMLVARRDALNASIALRRAEAWRIVERVVAGVPLNLPTPAEVPRWISWYGRSDFERMFKHLYGQYAGTTSGDGASAGSGDDTPGLQSTWTRRHARFPAGYFETIARWNAARADELGTWPAERYDAWIATLDRPARWHSLAGLARTLLSPAAVRHYFDHHGQVAACLDDPVVEDPAAPGLGEGNRTRCFGAEAPLDAVLIKPAWFRHGFARPLEVFDTSAERMAARLAQPGESWRADRTITPPADRFLSMEVDAGGEYLLTGLHIMSKELPDWVWITLWWSDEPDRDFGADRPASLGGVWRNYKMCVVTSFAETGQVDAALRDQHPELATALDVVQRAAAPDSWCSNPYLEEGPGNHTSNCIGCHQHAGTRLAAEEILADSARFGPGGRRAVRHSFPADYQWSFDASPERLARLVRARIEAHAMHEQE